MGPPKLVQSGAYILVYQLRSLIPGCASGARSHLSSKYFAHKEPVPVAINPRVESPKRVARTERPHRASPETNLERRPRPICVHHMDNVYPPPSFIGRTQRVPSPEVATSLNDLLSSSSHNAHTFIPTKLRQPTVIYTKPSGLYSNGDIPVQYASGDVGRVRLEPSNVDTHMDRRFRAPPREHEF
ncbi:hypothetical protein Ciccas_000225 [Cichlidogyrus casuarinus]|uniref:Uncharacterized protein n=1 Tax=Cichlidogyrus casuarinus TaxID=1844966 RepID=A0ABD2QNJ8_9PLAT